MSTNLSNEQGKCPICGCTNLNYSGTAEFDDEGVVYDWYCPVCEATGKETYNINFAGHYNVITNDGIEIPCMEDEI